MTLGNGRRILSIQSSVCSGYVGNRAATFPLQLLGYDVSCINTVQFSTHTGYPLVKGQKLSADDISLLYEGLASQADGFAGILTGYVPGDGIDAVFDIAKRVKSAVHDAQSSSSGSGSQENKVLWVLDPVMGDEERGLYVDSSIPPRYRQVIGQADIITPNQFELQLLAEIDIVDAASLRRAIARVHEMGVDKIVVTTFRDPARADKLIIVGSDKGNLFEIEAEYRERPYQGTGDLFAALLMAYSLAGESLLQAVTKVMDSMKPVLDLTGDKFDALVGTADWRSEKAAGRGAYICQACELRLIESAEAILHPEPYYTASRVGG